ncbi:MAG: hypothetical protein LRY51_00050 [Geovibrio sp.]|nr:hypothetical protein [Geovibrio sp.]
MLPYTLNAGNEATFYITFNPTTAGSTTRTVTITTDAGISTSFNVNGTGVATSDNNTGGGNNGGGSGDDDGEPKGGCSAGGSANMPIALFALAGMAKVIMRRRKEQE